MGVKYADQYEPHQLEPFWPNEIIKMICAVLCTMAVIMFFAVLPTLLDMAGIHGVAEHEQPADPRVTPPHIRPEWYFLSVYQYLKLMPAELFGMEGSTLGVLSQGLGVAVLVLLPFWFRVDGQRLAPSDARRGLAYFATACAAFAVTGGVVVVFNSWWGERIGMWFHPFFWWPGLAVVCWMSVYLYGRRAGFSAIGQWLGMLTVTALFIGFQAVTFIVVLGQGIARSGRPVLGYGIGGVLFLVAGLWGVALCRRRVAGHGDGARARLFLFTITENIALFLGLLLWALWPQGALRDEAGAWSDEAKQFFMVSAVIAAVLVVFYWLVFAERRNITRVLGKPAPTDG